MKNKIILICALVLVIILFVPIPSQKLKDGGTQSFNALTYKIVNWKRLVRNKYTYTETDVFWFPNNFKSIDELWESLYVKGAQSSITLEDYEAIKVGTKREDIHKKFGEPHNTLSGFYGDVYTIEDKSVIIYYAVDANDGATVELVKIKTSVDET